MQLTDGAIISVGVVIDATERPNPNTAALPVDALDEEGYVKATSSLEFLPNVPNSTFHYTIGDVCAGKGIRRIGAAMGMVMLASINIFISILAFEGRAANVEQLRLPDRPTSMSVVMGSQAVHCASPDSEVAWGKDVMAQVFGDNLAWESKFSTCCFVLIL